MRKRLYGLILFLLIISSEIALGKDGNKTKTYKVNHKKNNNLKDKSNNERLKRSLNDDEDKPFWANRGKKQIEYSIYNSRYDYDFEKSGKDLKNRDNIEQEPFWGTRGRRDSSPDENFIVMEYPENSVYNKYLHNINKNCQNCFATTQKIDYTNYRNLKDGRDEALSPFWGNRGRRNSDEIEELSSEPFWGNRGRRQENDPFWGTRGRRQESPFWGSRGRRDDEPFWGNRGRRDELDPFWGNRGRRDDSEPFWGNRGRRQESEPFWGNRGRREESEPFWGNRGRRKDAEPFLGNRGRRKEDLKESIYDGMNNMKNDIDHLSRLRRSNVGQNPFWSNTGRESKLTYLFNGQGRSRISILPQESSKALFGPKLKISEQGPVQDSATYAEEPHYIVIERSSRSSAENLLQDPFIISRGKKYYLDYNSIKAVRDRRGAIEEIVKSVRNDPYYIARGKKDIGKVGNSTEYDEEFAKAKGLICAAIDLIMVKNEHGKVKRQIDSDSDRRTMLKKLAAQLQIDPYFVSRGKKDDNYSMNEDNLRKFINDVAAKCE